MISSTEEDFELELRSLPGVLNVAVGHDERGDIDTVTLVVYGPNAPETHAVAHQIANLYFPGAEIVVEDANQAVRPVESLGRVQLVRAEFDAARGHCEVELQHRGRNGVGTVVSGALIGGASATLAALADLGYEVPFTLQSVTGVSVIRDWPVIVVLRPLGEGPDRYGVARSDDEFAAAAKATLDALNRYLLTRS